MVKWLEEITVTEAESDNFYHFHDNRVLPSHVTEVLAKREGVQLSHPWQHRESAIQAPCFCLLSTYLCHPLRGHRQEERCCWLYLLKYMNGCAPFNQLVLVQPVVLCAGWWYKPDFIINDININSAITSPAHDETVTLTGHNSFFTVRGYAYSGLLAALCHTATCHAVFCSCHASLSP